MARALKAALAVVLVSTTAVAVADTCMVSPTDKQTVSGRFGKFRGGGTGNFGSANQKPHMHDGLDFSTNGASQPLYATSDGVITFLGMRGTAGNAVLIKRDNGDVVAYYHMSGFATGLKQGMEIKAGQQIGLSGNTPSDAMVKHLHFTYGAAQKDAARSAAFPANAARGAFDPGQLPHVFNQQAGIGWKTDPAPYFCATFPIQDGNPQFYPILGDDTKEQHAILFGSVPSGGVAPNVKFEPAQVAAANADAALAASEGKSPAEWLSEKDGFGTLPTTPIGGYDTMSTSEMMLTEAGRRFSDAEWNANVTKVSSRALWVDYNRAVGVGSYLAEAIYRKKERVEALLAVYTSQKTERIRRQALAAHERAQRDVISRVIK